VLHVVASPKFVRAHPSHQRASVEILKAANLTPSSRAGSDGSGVDVQSVLKVRLNIIQNHGLVAVKFCFANKIKLYVSWVFPTLRYLRGKPQHA